MAETPGRNYCNEPGCPGNHELFSETCSDRSIQAAEYKGLEEFLKGEEIKAGMPEEATEAAPSTPNEWSGKDSKKSSGRTTQEMQMYNNKSKPNKMSPNRKQTSTNHIVQ